jgi:hypothetical protein
MRESLRVWCRAHCRLTLQVPASAPASRERRPDGSSNWWIECARGSDSAEVNPPRGERTVPATSVLSRSKASTSARNVLSLAPPVYVLARRPDLSISSECGSWRTCRDTPARCAKETWSTSTIFPRHSFRQPIRSKSRTMRRLARRVRLSRVRPSRSKRSMLSPNGNPG